MFSSNFISATREYATYDKAVAAPYLRRTFDLDLLPKTASLTVTGLGFYRLFVNGTDITKGLLAPYISNDDEIVYYDNYDLLPYLTVGENVLGFILGNGMHNCIGGSAWDFDLATFRSAPKLAFALALDNTVIEADENVLTHPSPILFDDLRCGVHYDAQKEIPGWNLPNFNAIGWAKAIPVEPARGKPVLCIAEPIRVYDELAPISITPNAKVISDYRIGTTHTRWTKLFYDCAEDNAKSGFLYDFGQNNAGVIRLKIRGTKGQRIVIQTAEKLRDDGTIDYRNIHFQPDGYVQRDIYICKGNGEEEIFVPDFTYHGFRYALVIGITEQQATNDLLMYLVAGSDLSQRSDFSCSDETANKLWAASVRSDRSNLYYVPTDCPHREKNAWTGDASISSEHMMQKYAMENTFKAWLQSIRSAQREDGVLPCIIPTAADWGYEWSNGPLWTSVAFNLPYYTWLYCGDTEVVTENAAMMLRYLSYVLTKRDGCGLIAIGLGDWCPVGKAPDSYDSPLEFTDTVVVMDCARKTSIMLRAVGMNEQAAFAESVYHSTRNAIRTHLIDFNTMTVLGSCQTSQAVALALGVFDAGERHEAFTRLVEFVEQRDEHIDTGFFGARYIFDVLSDFGEEDLAYHMITRADSFSYGCWVEKFGATTLFESFNSSGNCDASLNHHFWGSFSGWFVRGILGIRVNPHEFSAKNVDVAPKFIKKLDYAKGFYDTVCGRLSIEWKRDGNSIILNISVPDGICGNIILPISYRFADRGGHATLPLASGEYRLLSMKRVSTKQNTTKESQWNE